MKRKAKYQQTLDKAAKELLRPFHSPERRAMEEKLLKGEKELQKMKEEFLKKYPNFQW